MFPYTTFNVGEKQIVIFLHQILYIESQGKDDCIIHLAGNQTLAFKNASVKQVMETMIKNTITLDRDK